MESLRLKDYFKILGRRSWIIAVCVLTSCIVTGVVSFYYVHPIYKATAKLIVNKWPSDQQLNQRINVDDLSANIMLINTYKEIITAAPVMEEVVRRHPEFRLAPEALSRLLRVSSVSQTQIMSISVSDYSYQRAADIVNAVAEAFKDMIPVIMKLDNIEILEKANTDFVPPPSNPSPLIHLFLSFVLSLVLSVALVFLLEHLDDSVKTEREAEAILGAAIFGKIGVIRKKDLQRRKEGKLKMHVEEDPYAPVGT
ncbi:MAG TPA: Wzz/FepE/Etk N-terminal domain-containing protein [Bacilli bacterium]